jgi:hypothetical protein
MANDDENPKNEFESDPELIDKTSWNQANQGKKSSDKIDFALKESKAEVHKNDKSDTSDVDCEKKE